ncbi:MAG TPA: phosphate ABC transporter substrate-binding protein PstS [Candidatus Dormibacteraeota bacterium]|nr:phosphate ABC transporter substrate-binding protein PstS [Candidatus Dormibacteraeota bacterium]
MFSGRKVGRALLVGIAAAMVTAACGSTNGSGSASPSPVDVGSGALTGAGATFPAPFYQKAFFDYTAKYPQVTVNYQAVGSGAGISQFQKATVDFGASDVPMSAADIAKVTGGASALVQVPTTLGVISIAYNLSGVSKLQLDGPTLANIYLGHITKWNDPAITALNSGATLPSSAIQVVHRADSSGTSFHFTDYLAKVSDEWKSKVGVGKAVKWPAGIGGSGNQGVAQAVSSTAGSIGYVELAYVVQTGMTQAYIKNADGNFVQASVAGATAAAAQNTNVSPTNYSITNEPGAQSYPIAGFSWVILPTAVSDAAKGKALVYLFKWLVTDGQTDGTSLQYAALPTPVQTLALTNLKTIKAAGNAVLT